MSSTQKKRGSGKKPLPESLKKLKGTLRESRRKNNAPEPLPDVATAQPIIMCQEKAAESFTLFQKIIAEMGNDSATFAHGMSLMALLWADMEQLQAEVAAEGWTLETETARGSVEVKTNPKVKLLRDIQKELRMWFAEFGLTPSSIQRVGQQKQQEKNIFEKFLEH